MEEADKDWMMIKMVGGWVFLLVPAQPASPGQRAVKWLLLLNAYYFHIKTIFRHQKESLHFKETISHKTSSDDLPMGKGKMTPQTSPHMQLWLVPTLQHVDTMLLSSAAKVVSTRQKPDI